MGWRVANYHQANDHQTSISVSIHLSLTRAHAWDVIWREKGQRSWLGPASQIRLQPDSRITLCNETGPWREAILLTCQDMAEVTFLVDGISGWPENGQTHLSIALSDSSDPKRCFLTIRETGIPEGCLQAVSQYWQRRKENLERMDRQIRNRCENPRQAVVLIHGIGEQQPGEMLHSFLGSGVLGNKKAFSWIKPDRLSQSFELRMATLNSDKQRPTTDVFEIYWAHIIRDTTLDQLASWLAGLLLRWPLRRERVKGTAVPSLRETWSWNVPKAILPLWLFAWIVLLIGILMVIGTVLRTGWSAWILWLVSLPLLVILVKIIWQKLGLSLAINYLGDAARYLQPHPANIAHRQAIRAEGVELLERIHDSGRYDRIVLVGHSLGSVIAYDILTHAWAKMNSIHLRPSLRRRANGEGPFHSLRRVEKAAAENLEDLRQAQWLQHEAWKGMRVNTQPWLVTDLVTLGSPLAHAEFLMTRKAQSFQQLKRSRSLPASPPWLEVRGPARDAKSKPYPRLRFSYEQGYRTPLGDQQHTFTLCHHAGMFAVTRWSNIHTPTTEFGLGGDLVSGKLGIKEGFGQWIVDHAVTPQRFRFMHTWYWNKSLGPKNEAAKRIKLVKKVLRLDSKDELRALNQEIPAYTFLEHLG